MQSEPLSVILLRILQLYQECESVPGDLSGWYVSGCGRRMYSPWSNIGHQRESAATQKALYSPAMVCPSSSSTSASDCSSSSSSCCTPRLFHEPFFLTDVALTRLLDG